MDYTILRWTAVVEFVILLLWCLRQMMPYKHLVKPYDPFFEAHYREQLRDRMRGTNDRRKN
jgi:hypothetical protein